MFVDVPPAAAHGGWRAAECREVARALRPGPLLASGEEVERLLER